MARRKILHPVIDVKIMRSFYLGKTLKDIAGLHGVSYTKVQNTITKYLKND